MVLLRVYAKCIYSQDQMVTQRIEAALALPPTKTEAKPSADMAEEEGTTATPATTTPAEPGEAQTSYRIATQQP